MLLEQREQRGRTPTVSVIIPTSNSGRTLARCLQSIRKQGYSAAEVVVVDKYSVDATRRIAEEFGATVILHRGNQAAARNVGLAHARGEYVLFLDSDQQLDARVLEACVGTCRTRGVAAVKIPECFVGQGFWSRCSALWKNSVVDAWGPRGGIPRFYKRDALLQSTAFNEALGVWEDRELHQRLTSHGVQDAWCRSRVFHYEVDALPKVIRKYVAYGGAIAAVKEGGIRTPYAATMRLTLATLRHVVTKPRSTVGTVLGCLVLVGVKGLSVALGFLLRPGRSGLQGM
jgi:glycosyltransferase involved in cell wall biosynthesis